MGTSRRDMVFGMCGYGLGTSLVNLVERVGGGIFTKAADVGSDLAGNLYPGLDEDSCRNPGVIADNVGDIVGDLVSFNGDILSTFMELVLISFVPPFPLSNS